VEDGNAGHGTAARSGCSARAAARSSPGASRSPHALAQATTSGPPWALPLLIAPADTPRARRSPAGYPAISGHPAFAAAPSARYHIFATFLSRFAPLVFSIADMSTPFTRRRGG